MKMAGYRDREYNFLAIDGTAVADGSDQEDSVDLSNYGVSMGNFMGMRIWKVEFGLRANDDYLVTGIGAALDTSEMTLRTITSGTTPPDFNDDGVIAQRAITVSPAATSGSGKFVEHDYGLHFPKGLLVVTDRLYVYFNNEIGVSSPALRCRVWFTLEKMSESDWREAWEVWRRA